MQTLQNVKDQEITVMQHDSFEGERIVLPGFNGEVYLKKGTYRVLLSDLDKQNKNGEVERYLQTLISKTTT